MSIFAKPSFDGFRSLEAKKIAVAMSISQGLIRRTIERQFRPLMNNRQSTAGLYDTNTRRNDHAIPKHLQAC
jgi:hypothetical protein